MEKTMYRVIKIYAQVGKGEIHRGVTLEFDDLPLEEVMAPTESEAAAREKLEKCENEYRNNGSGLREVTEYWLEEAKWNVDGDDVEFVEGSNYDNCPNEDWIGCKDPESSSDDDEDE